MHSYNMVILEDEKATELHRRMFQQVGATSGVKPVAQRVGIAQRV